MPEDQKNTEEKITRKPRARKEHNYDFADQTINLNGYVAICNVTGEQKRFYHAYLADMIAKQFDNNFAQFEANYVSRAGKSVNSAAVKAAKLEDRIDALYAKIRSLKTQRDELAVN